jgi:hypothetical protein
MGLKLTLVIALVMNGMLAGMTIDQSVKQLPARRVIGASAYSRYSRASDLGNGIWLYAIFGLGAPTSSLALTVASVSSLGWGASLSIGAATSLALCVCQLVLTTQAAPTNFSQRRYSVEDETALQRVFDKFERIQTLRSFAVVLAFGAVLYSTWSAIVVK